MTRIPIEPSVRTLRRGEKIDVWFDAIWASLLGLTLLISGERFLHSAAWQRVLDFAPGGRPTVVWIIAVAGIVSLVLICTRRLRVMALTTVSAWCFFVASFQMYAAFNDDAGPLGFFAWYYVSFQILRHAFSQSPRLH